MSPRTLSAEEIATFDRDGGVRVYRDGELLDVESMEPGDVDAFAINIGQDGTGVYPHFFEGAIDDLAIWRRVLNADEIAILAMGREFGGLIACATDLDGSGAVDFPDLLAVLAAWGPCRACAEDFDNDGAVGFQDLLLLLASWGACS